MEFTARILIDKTDQLSLAKKQHHTHNMQATATGFELTPSGPNTFHSIGPVHLQKTTKQQIRTYFENGFDIDETLFKCVVHKMDFYTNPDELRLALIFYLVHPATLFINKLLLVGALKKRINESFEAIFETGVDEMSWDDVVSVCRIDDPSSFKWPSVEEAMDYRAKARKVILDLIDEHPLELPITTQSQNGFWWAILLGCEHERIHIETSSCLLRQLAVDRIRFPPSWTYAPIQLATAKPENKFISLPACEVKMGKPNNFPFFGWCNEYGQQRMSVPQFECQQFLVTNGEFLEFVKDAGYAKEEYWTKEGWQWRLYVGRLHPKWWVPVHTKVAHLSVTDKLGAENLLHKSPASCCVGDDSQTCNHHDSEQQTHIYRYRAMFSEIDMPLDWPVDVNYHEAKAYAKWKGDDYRLPTEAEYWTIRGLEQKTIEGTLNEQDENSVEDQCNLYLKYSSSTPVHMYPPNAKGFYDVSGNVWQWCEDHFNGFEYYDSHFLYDDYASPCFDARHNVIVGGSWISSGDEASIFARYGFRRHFMQHAGFRLVRSTNPPPVRLISTKVFVLGAGVTETQTEIPHLTHPEKAMSPSANTQILFDTPNQLLNTLIAQYGTGSQYDPHHLISTSSNASNPNSVYVNKVFELVMKEMKDLNITNTSSAIEIGTETGYLAFLLSSRFSHVKGIDYCARFIDAAQKLKTQNNINNTYFIPTNAKPDRVKFYQLTWLPVEIGSKHSLVILSNNYLNRCLNYQPWLMRLKELIIPGGLAVISHFVITDKENRASNCNNNSSNNKHYTNSLIKDTSDVGKSLHPDVTLSIDVIQVLIGQYFDLLSTNDLLHTTRNNATEFARRTSRISVWRRNKHQVN